MQTPRVESRARAAEMQQRSAESQNASARMQMASGDSAGLAALHPNCAVSEGDCCAGPCRPASVVFRRMLPQSRSYDELVRQFRWQVPASFNIGVEVCDRWAERDPGKLALVAVSQDGQARDVSYGWLRETS